VRPRRSWRDRLIAAAAALVAATAAAQPSGRLATSAEALVASPVFFHGRQITVRRELAEARGLVELAGTSKPIFVFWREHPTTTRDGEIRGEFWDLGRLRPDDARFASQDFHAVLEAASKGEWPARDRVFVILGATFVESPLPDQPSIRALALAPEKYADRGVTIVGRFRGRNLFGDLPLPAGKSRWDFVLQAADGAVWVTGLRPRGKGFDLDVEARVDTGRWLEVTGTVRRDGPLSWIEASSIAAASAPTDTPVEIAVPARPREAPPQVVFTAPVANDTDVERAAPVRIQFSRDMQGATFRDRVRVAYTGNAAPGAPAPPPFTIKYNEGTRALEIKFSAPLDRFRTIRIDLLEGILSAVDNQPLAPWSMTFTTGG
jgi:Big-like domain-containing protein